MKKLSILFCSIFLLFSCAGKAQTNTEVTGKFVKALGSEQFDEAIAYCDPTVKEITREVLQGAWGQIKAAFGPYKSYSVAEGTDPNASPVTVLIQFEKKELGFLCSFNSNHQLNGFVLAPPGAGQAASQTASASAFPQQEVIIPVSGGSLKGSLMKPNDYIAGKTPVALILAGSGATDRDCNNGSTLHTNAYKMLAEKLAENGIASLRYDKRLVGKSMNFVPDESKLSFDNYVQDAVQAVEFLKSNQSFTRIYIIGHSEGALVGTLAAGRVKADAFVSLCGAGENIANTLKRQLNNPAADTIIDQLKSGSMTGDVPQSMQVTFRLSVQPYLISWMKYEPAQELTRLQMPVLIIGGTTDLQVPPADAEMLKNGAPKAILKIISGMNHILKDAPADRNANLVTYTQENLPLNAELVADLLQFLGQK